MDRTTKMLPKYKATTAQKKSRKKKTHEEYVNEVAIKNPNVKVIGKYIDAKTKIVHKCLIDNYEWLITPNKILSGKGCPKCAGNNKKTHEEYIYELLIKNPNLQAIGTYNGANTKIAHRCLTHDVCWQLSPSCALKGYGCSECAKEKIGNKNGKSHEEYVSEVKKLSSHIDVLGLYVNHMTPILHKCTVHNIEWEAHPSSILHGSGCYECGLEKLKNIKIKTDDQYKKELKSINPNIIALDKYIGSEISILHKCLIDGNEWYARPYNTLYGKGCPKCNESKGEKQVSLYLDKYNIKYETQKTFDGCYDIKLLPFDFYLPDYNCCIEYDGKQHFEPIEYFGGQETFEYTQKHDNIKNEYCKNNGISLLRIPYFKDVEEELNNFLFI